MSTLTINVDLNAKGINPGVASVRAEMGQLGDSAEKTGRKMRSVASIDFSGLKSQMASVFSGNLAASAVQMISSKLLEGGKAILDYSGRMQQLDIAFTTMMGSADNAKKHLSDLKKFAVDTPFEFESLAKMSQRLQGVKVDAGQVIPLMRDIGNVTAATGEISADRVEGITVALTQMIGKTKISAEEMEQLAERGVPAWQILSEGIGKSQAETRKLAESGVLTSDIMVKAIQKISREKWGDAMEKQSKTAFGAWSTITDTIQQSAATAFEPLFKQIADLSVRFSQEIQAQGNDFKAVGEVIAKYIGEGLGIGLGAVLSSIGGYVSDRLVNIFTKGEVVDPLFKQLATGFLKPFGIGLDSVGGGLQNTVNPALGQVQNNLEKINKEAAKTPSIAESLDAARAKKEAEALKNIISDLGLKIRFFGQETQVAATKQQLLKQGISDFSSAQARTVLAYAQTLDNLQKIQELQQKDKDAADERIKKLKDLSDELTQMREDAHFEMAFPNASELDRFSRWVKDNTAGFRELSPEIAKTREELRKLEFQKGIADRNRAINDFAASVKQTLDDLNGVDITPFQEKLAQLVEPLGPLKNALGTVTLPQDFAREIESRMYQYINEQDSIRATADALTGDPKLIETELDKRLKTLHDRWYDGLQLYLEQFKKFNTNGTLEIDPISGLAANTFADSADYANIVRLIGLFNSLENKPALDQGKERKNIEKEIANLQRQNADDQFVEQRRLLSAKREQLSLEQEIAGLQDALANAGVNDALIIEAERLKNILELRDRELDAVLAIQKAQIELSHAMEISGNQIRARVMDHLAQQQTLNEAIANGINKTYDFFAAKLDENIDRLFAWAGKWKDAFAFITEPLKAIARNSLTSITTKFLDMIIPGGGAMYEKAKNPVAR